jgi:hypothetical protein
MAVYFITSFTAHENLLVDAIGVEELSSLFLLTIQEHDVWSIFRRIFSRGNVPNFSVVKCI